MEPAKLETIQRIAKKLSHKYTFGHYDAVDIEQEAIIIGLKSIKKYNESLPLENFLYVSIRNGLINFRRDNYHRKACTCGECKPCIRREQKKNILEPVSIDLINDVNETHTYVASEQYDIQDIQNLIDENLPAEYREDYLKMISGVKISSSVKKKIISIIEEIIRE